jgi:predicted lipid-binding transport protein (Tim44 family)
MKRILVTVFVTVFTLATIGLMAPDAEAKRLGGGMSSGMTRSSTVMKRDPIPAKPATPTATPAPAGVAPAAAPARSGMGRWLGPIAGLAAGLGIAALLSHFGLGEGMANFVMIALLVMAVIFVLRLLFSRRSPENTAQYAANGGDNFQPQYQSVQPIAPLSSGGNINTGTVPADFDVDGFLRQAKLNFVRLQAANDSGDMPDISHFTSPELFAEIQMQYQERGRTTQQTDVVQLNADLLDVSDEGGNTVASVRFHGQIRESVNAAPEYFSEVWHLLRPHDGSKGWFVAGIQQSE